MNETLDTRTNLPQDNKTSEEIATEVIENKINSRGQDRHFEMLVAAALDRCDGADYGDSSRNDELSGKNNIRNEQCQKTAKLKNDREDDGKVSGSSDSNDNGSSYDGDANQDYDDDSTSCSSASDDSSDDNNAGEAEDDRDNYEDSTIDPNLSEYERLRLRNIQRNEARLARLGLLVSSSSKLGVNSNNLSGSATTSLVNTATGMTSSRSNLLNISTHNSLKKDRPRIYNKAKTGKMTKQRSQPRRRAKRKSRNNIRYSKSGLLIQNSYFKFDLDPTIIDGKRVYHSHDKGNDEDEDESFCGSEESSIPSPVPLKKILRPLSVPLLSFRDKDGYDNMQSYGIDAENKKVKNSAATSPIRATPHSIPSQCSTIANSRNPSLPLFEDTDLLSNAPKRRSRGRPKREEYILICDEKCCHCGGDWNRDPSTIGANNNGVGSENDNGDCDDECSALIRCKDCRKTFHLCCMLNHERVGVDEEVTGIEGGGRGYNEVKKDNIHVIATNLNKSTSASGLESGPSQDGTNVTLDCGRINVLDQMQHIPKRCLSCKRHHNLKLDDGATSAYPKKRNNFRLNEPIQPPIASKKAKFRQDGDFISPPLLDAIVGCKLMRVKVNPEVALVADIDTDDIMCRVTFSRKVSNFKERSANEVHTIRERRKNGHKINESNPTLHKIEKLIFTALQRLRDVKVQGKMFAKLRKLIASRNEATAISHFGGIGMLSNTMTNHKEKSLIQAEAIATLAELAWADPSLCCETVKAGCISLVLAAMEKHHAYAKLQQMAIGYFRSLSYDAKCCQSMNKFKTVDAVIRSMYKNPKKFGIICEGSAYLQNMIVVSSGTIKSILELQSEEYSNILSLLVKLADDNHCNSELVYSICGLFTNVSLSSKGKMVLSHEGAGPTLHKVLKTAKGADLAHAAIAALFSLASKNGMLNKMLVEDSIISTILSVLKLFRQSTTIEVCFGLLEELCKASECALQLVRESDIISIAMNSMQIHSEIPELVASAFSFLRMVVTVEKNERFHLDLAKRVLSAMKDNPDEGSVQSIGCHLLADLPKCRALKNLFQHKRTETILILAAKAFPDLCKNAINNIFQR